MILDDEKYFTYDGSNMQGNDNYYTNDISKCLDCIRFAEKEISEQRNGLDSHIQSWYIQAIISSIEVRGSRFGHLYKRMLRETLA